MDHPKTEAGLRARIEALTTLMRTEREERQREIKENNVKLREINDRIEENNVKLREINDRIEENNVKLKESVDRCIDRLRNKRRTPD